MSFILNYLIQDINSNTKQFLISSSSRSISIYLSLLIISSIIIIESILIIIIPAKPSIILLFLYSIVIVLPANVVLFYFCIALQTSLGFTNTINTYPFDLPFLLYTILVFIILHSFLKRGYNLLLPT